MALIGFVVNPIAGMGGRVGLKGTDGVLSEALARGAVQVASERGMRMLNALRTALELPGHPANPVQISWLTAAGSMGADLLSRAGVPESALEIIYTPPRAETTAEDTKAACRIFIARGVELVLFCGGDGTASDIFSVVDQKVPMLGIPSGVKMHSGVFGVTPEAAAQTLDEYLSGKLSLAEVELMDLDENAYRRGEWKLNLVGTVRTPFEPSFIQGSKMMIESATEDEIKSEIAAFMVEEMDALPGVLFILGPGSTLNALGDALKIDKTLLGVDAVVDKKQIGKDLNESALLALLDRYPDARVLLSPIGNQGFVLGRGNHQLSSAVIRRINLENIWILTTPAKLARTPKLRVDTGDTALDAEMTARKSYRIIIGYRFMRRLALSGCD